MYPRNASTPERIAIGPVVQISDGAVQTSGVSVKVMPQGASAAAGLGTVAYEEGVVAYTPTQAETNYTSFILIAYKTGCVPSSTTVVTVDTVTTGVLEAASIGANAANKIADHCRRRTQANVEASTDGDALGISSEYGLIQQSQESSAAGATLSVYRTDGSTVLGTRSLTTNLSAAPITGIS